MMGGLPSSSTISPHRDRVNLEMHSEAVIERVWRPRSGELGGHDLVNLEAVIVRTWRP